MATYWLRYTYPLSFPSFKGPTKQTRTIEFIAFSDEEACKKAEEKIKELTKHGTWGWSFRLLKEIELPKM